MFTDRELLLMLNSTHERAMELSNYAGQLARKNYRDMAGKETSIEHCREMLRGHHEHLRLVNKIRKIRLTLQEETIMEVGPLSEDEKKVVLDMREKQIVSNPRDFKKGEVIITTSGQCDDYAIMYSYIINSDFNVLTQLNLWAKSLGVEVEDDEVVCHNSEDAGNKGFMYWLADNDYVTEVKYYEIGLPVEWETDSTRIL